MDDRGDSGDSDQDSPFAISESLVPPRELKTAGTTSLDFDGLLSEPLVLQEDLKEGCGGQLWPAGIVLSKYMLRRHKSDLRGKTIVELGAGGGLVGLAVARGCSVDAPIYITDQKPMLALMEANIKLNNLSPLVKASILDWGTPIPESIPQHPAVILAADCVYFEPAFPLLVDTLRSLIGPDTICYFCFKRRRRADLRFIKLARKAFNITEVEDDPDRPTYSRENITIYVIKSKSPAKTTAVKSSSDA
ncbi:Protein-lysine N-methyltransferase efm6 [Paecilomyces lecythidis]|uniref:Protein-lysine N-methyltransferase EFM6 n=1 Tax=Paecilomyces lecythidis TaxID=3004212 RepID=A0ABR3X8S8_9EURO